MVMLKFRKINFYSFFFFFLFIAGHIFAMPDPLPSWNEGAIKTAIIEFVNQAVNEASVGYIAPNDRIATFDNDGTLWIEQPVYVEFFFALDRVKDLAPKHPEWVNQEPYKSVLAGDIEAIKKFDMKEIVQLIEATHAGMSVDDFHKIVQKWIKTAIHPRFKRPFTELIYQPMQEVIKFLKDNGFNVYIASGGGQEFMRSFTNNLYGILPGNIIGTAGKVKYENQDGQPVLKKLPELLFNDDKGGKPEGINLIIGQKPKASFGNSVGDREMLEWTQSNKGKTFQLLVHHDDAVREYAYGSNSKVGTFTDALMEEARRKGWNVVSMKNDWKVIFPWQLPQN